MIKFDPVDLGICRVPPVGIGYLHRYRERKGLDETLAQEAGPLVNPYMNAGSAALKTAESE